MNVQIGLPIPIRSDSNPFDLIEHDLIRSSVIEFCGSGTLVSRNCLRILDSSTVFQISCDACGSKRVATDLVGKSSSDRSPFDHSKSVMTAKLFRYINATSSSRNVIRLFSSQTAPELLLLE